jgi:hypothetical protein
VNYQTLRTCANRGAFEAIPEGDPHLDLKGVKDRIEAAGIRVLDCRVMLIAQFDREVTIGRDGRILIKSLERDEAVRILEQVRAYVEPTALV